MATRYEKRNERVIRNAFKRLPASKDRVARKGLEDLLENAMLYALGEHDHRHWLHKSTANSYGWAIVHNGSVVAHKVNEGRHGDGNAYSDMMSVARGVSQSGWIGILLASMHGDRPMYFAVDYERALLEETADVTKENFGLFFNIVTGPSSAVPTGDE